MENYLGLRKIILTERKLVFYACPLPQQRFIVDIKFYCLLLVLAPTPPRPPSQSRGDKQRSARLLEHIFSPTTVVPCPLQCWAPILNQNQFSGDQKFLLIFKKIHIYAIYSNCKEFVQRYFAYCSNSYKITHSYLLASFKYYDIFFSCVCSPPLIAKYIQVFLLCQKLKWDWLFIVIISKFLYDKETRYRVD